MGLGPGGTPETSPATSEKKVDYGIDRIKETTKDELSTLKKTVDEKGQVGTLMESILGEGIRGLKEDLIELGIAESDHKKYIDEFQSKMNEKISGIQQDQIITSEEVVALESFITDLNNFPSLNEAIRNKSMDKYGKWTKDIDEILVSVAGIFGWKIGEPHMRAKLYEAANWLGKKLGITGLIKTVDSKEKNPETKKVTDMLIGELLANGSKAGDEGKKEREYLGKMFDKNEFGELGGVTENSLTFNKKGETITYTIEKNSLSNTWEIARNGQSEAIYDLKNGAAPAARRLNQKILNA